MVWGADAKGICSFIVEYKFREWSKSREMRRAMCEISWALACRIAECRKREYEEGGRGGGHEMLQSPS